MDKLKMTTADKVDVNIEKIEILFPNCVTERVDESGNVEKAIDFDMLKQELSHVVVDGAQERYQFTWPDKKKSILLANAPINKTLRPVVRDEQIPTGADTSGQPYMSSGSVGKNGEAGGFDSENLYIEGDNLDALKLLQETYMGKIKMIYIDPPYNTGKDFVYGDDFAMSSDEYMENSGQLDEQGNRLFQNNESNGRFHTDWLNIIYPRLKLAKELLTDDGVIFISTDDHEVCNLTKTCDEIFGIKNKVALVSTINNLKGRSDDDFFATCNEFLLIYCREISSLKIDGFELEDEEYEKDYTINDEMGAYKLIGLRKTGTGWERYNRPFMFYPILYRDNRFRTISRQEQEMIYDSKNKSFNEDVIEDMTNHYLQVGYKVFWPKNEKGEWGRWRWGVETFNQQKDLNLEINSSNTICTKMRATLENGTIRVKTAKTVWYKPEYDTGNGAKILKILFQNSSDIFENPKSLIYIKDIIKIATKKDSIILDFFSGSATTAHAVMQLNVEDGGNRKFIMVQLPEVTDEKSEAYKAGYKNICEIGKERIRRAGKKIKADRNIKIGLDKNKLIERKRLDDGTVEDKYGIKVTPAPDDDILDNLDIGFRVLKLDTSNMKDVYYRAENYSQSLLDTLEGNIKADRTPQDLLLQVMLDMGVMLSSKIEERKFAMQNGQCVMVNAQGATIDEQNCSNLTTIYIVGDYSANIQPNLIACFDDNLSNEVVTAIAKMKPLYAVFRDSSFANDSVATNFEQIFSTYSPTTTRKVI